MHRGRMTDHQLDGAKIHAERDRACPFLRAVTAKADQSLAIQLRNRQCAQFALEHLECRALGALWRFADVFHVVNVQINQRAKRLGGTRAPAGWRTTFVDLRLGAARPFARVVVAQKGLARLATLQADLDLPVSRW